MCRLTGRGLDDYMGFGNCNVQIRVVGLDLFRGKIYEELWRKAYVFIWMESGDLPPQMKPSKCEKYFDISLWILTGIFLFVVCFFCVFFY